MGQAQFTQGDWEHDEVSDAVFCGATIIAECGGSTDRFGSVDEQTANAKLITRAPRLLQALNYLLEQTVDQDLKYGIELTEGEQDARRQALEVIAEATGKERA